MITTSPPTLHPEFVTELARRAPGLALTWRGCPTMPEVGWWETMKGRLHVTPCHWVFFDDWPVYPEAGVLPTPEGAAAAVAWRWRRWVENAGGIAA